MNSAQRDTIYVISVFSVITLVSAVAFGLLHIVVEDNVELGIIELVAAGIAGVNLAILRGFRTINSARIVLLACISTLLLALLITGGTHGTGIFWVFVFPNTAFYLAGKRRGLWLIGAFVGTVVVITALKQMDVLSVPYSLTAIRQMLISLLVVAVGVYVYENAREKALARSQASQHDLQEYLDHLTTFSAKIGVDGSVLFANSLAKEVSGLGESLIGARFLDGPWWSYDPNVQRRVEAAFYQALSGKQVNYDERMRVANPNGDMTLTVNFSMVPIFEGKRISYVLAEARDISAEQAVDQARSEFVALASKQLHTPVANISHLLSSVLHDPGIQQLSPALQQDLQRIHATNTHLVSLIEDMVLVSSLELGNMPIRPIPTNLGELAHKVAQEMLANHSRNLEENYAENVPAVPLDPNLTMILLRNLLSNAIFATPDNGHISIRVSQTDKDSPAGVGNLQIDIQDNGRGIASQDQAKVFSKYFQTHQSGESGLGLYIVKLLVEYVGGSITFASKEHAGTIFSVVLPLSGMKPRA